MDTFEKLANVLKNKQIKTIFHPQNSLRNILDKEKDRINPMQKKGVYLVPFSCEDVYIGESIRSIQIRLKEHCVDIKQKRKKSALVVHSLKTKHQIRMEDAKVIALEDHYNKRKIREAIEIEKHIIFFNKDDGLIFCKSRKPIIHSLKEKTNSQPIQKMTRNNYLLRKNNLDSIETPHS